MRPPEHWHLRHYRQRRPSSHRWLLLSLVALFVVGGAALWHFGLPGGDASGDRQSAVASNALEPDASRSLAPDVAITPTPDLCAEAIQCDAPTVTPPCPEGDTGCLPAVGRAEFGGSGALPSGDYLAESDAPPPSISAETAAVVEQSCGALLYGLRAHERRPPASLTKIVTALVAVERTTATEMVDIDVNGDLLKASTNSSVMGLKPGQRLAMNDLLHGLLMTSGNDAAIAIAEHVSGSIPAFVVLMNEKVRELGLQNTHLVNPHGLDEPDLYTSAYDIAILGRELLAEPELAPIVSTQKWQPAWDGPQIWNGNELLYEYQGAIGIKTGTTPQAGQTFVAAARRDGRTIIVSVLRGWARYTDAAALLDWAFANTTSPC
ncbi:MAG: D-alanyl-D-alanine carboxypeptidase family protein [Dehalococcoidia bacterium]